MLGVCPCALQPAGRRAGEALMDMKGGRFDGEPVPPLFMSFTYQLDDKT